MHLILKVIVKINEEIVPSCYKVLLTYKYGVNRLYGTYYVVAHETKLWFASRLVKCLRTKLRGSPKALVTKVIL